MSILSTPGQNALNNANQLAVANVNSPAAQQAAKPGLSALDWFKAFAPIAAAGIQAWSSARFKRAIHPMDPDEYEQALERVRATPITRYRYRWEPDQGPPHIGPILELAPPEISDDGVRVNLLDFSGLLAAGLKAVDRRVIRLESGQLAPPTRRVKRVQGRRLA